MKINVKKFRRNSVAVLASLGMACAGVTTQGLGFTSLSTLRHSISAAFWGLTGIGMNVYAKTIGQGAGLIFSQFLRLNEEEFLDDDIKAVSDGAKKFAHVTSVLPFLASLVNASDAVQSARNNDAHEKLKKIEDNNKKLATLSQQYAPGVKIMNSGARLGGAGAPGVVQVSNSGGIQRNVSFPSATQGPLNTVQK